MLAMAIVDSVTASRFLVTGESRDKVLHKCIWV
jgi:hypothetical protein